MAEWHCNRGHLVKENALFQKTESIEGHFPVLLSLDEELEQLETPEAEGEDMPQEEGVDWAQTEAERIAIQHAHDNAGHPALRKFVRLLKQGGAPDEIVRWVSQNTSVNSAWLPKDHLLGFPFQYQGARGSMPS
eukprot:6492719-Amphidinium_carterae.4